jgi:hypothetical protein
MEWLFPLTCVTVPNNLHTAHIYTAHFERASTQMRMFVKALCLLSVVATVTAAKADSFKLTGDGNTYLFSIDGSPTVTDILYGFTVNDVAVTENGILQPESTLTFYDASSQGGLEIQPSGVLIFNSDQLFSGSNDAPAFLLGTFKLTDDVDNSNYKLVIKADKGDPSASPVPEPSSVALLATGALAFAGAVRRKLLAC